MFQLNFFFWVNRVCFSLISSNSFPLKLSYKESTYKKKVVRKVKGKYCTSIIQKHLGVKTAQNDKVKLYLPLYLLSMLFDLSK